MPVLFQYTYIIDFKSYVLIIQNLLFPPSQEDVSLLTVKHLFLLITLTSANNDLYRSVQKHKQTMGDYDRT